MKATAFTFITGVERWLRIYLNEYKPFEDETITTTRILNFNKEMGVLSFWKGEQLDFQIVHSANIKGPSLLLYIHVLTLHPNKSEQCFNVIVYNANKEKLRELIVHTDNHAKFVRESEYVFNLIKEIWEKGKESIPKNENLDPEVTVDKLFPKPVKRENVKIVAPVKEEEEKVEEKPKKTPRPPVSNKTIAKPPSKPAESPPANQPETPPQAVAEEKPKEEAGTMDQSDIDNLLTSLFP